MEDEKSHNLIFEYSRKAYWHTANHTPYLVQHLQQSQGLKYFCFRKTSWHHLQTDGNQITWNTLSTLSTHQKLKPRKYNGMVRGPDVETEQKTKQHCNLTASAKPG